MMFPSTQPMAPQWGMNAARSTPQDTTAQSASAERNSTFTPASAAGVSDSFAPSVSPAWVNVESGQARLETSQKMTAASSHSAQSAAALPTTPKPVAPVAEPQAIKVGNTLKLINDNPDKNLEVLNMALKRWIAEKGALPERLEQLVMEEYLPMLPMEPTGKRFTIDRVKKVIILVDKNLQNTTSRKVDMISEAQPVAASSKPKLKTLSPLEQAKLRLRKAKEAESQLLPGKAIKQNGGVPHKGAPVANVMLTGYGDYDNKLLTAIHNSWVRKNHEARMRKPYKVVAEFELLSSGDIKNLRVVSPKSVLARTVPELICTTSIDEPAPFERWDEKMKSALGTRRPCRIIFSFNIRD